MDIIIYLFVHDDSLTSKKFTKRTEQPTKCCEPLYIIAEGEDMYPTSNFILLLVVSMRYFCSGSSCFAFWY